jgi:hypothetical protein
LSFEENRLVDDTGGQEKYKQIEALNWSKTEIEQGKIIKIKTFPQDKKVKLFRVSISTDRTEYIATNDLTQNSTDAVQEVCDIRWKIEEFHARNKAINGRGILPVPLHRVSRGIIFTAPCLFGCDSNTWLILQVKLFISLSTAYSLITLFNNLNVRCLL